MKQIVGAASAEVVVVYVVVSGSWLVGCNLNVFAMIILRVNLLLAIYRSNMQK